MEVIYTTKAKVVKETPVKESPITKPITREYLMSKGKVVDKKTLGESRDRVLNILISNHPMPLKQGDIKRITELSSTQKPLTDQNVYNYLNKKENNYGLIPKGIVVKLQIDKGIYYALSDSYVLENKL